MKTLRFFAIAVWGSAFLLGLVVLVARMGFPRPMATAAIEMLMATAAIEIPTVPTAIEIPTAPAAIEMPTATAAIEMPANHLVRAADLENPTNGSTFIGTYLRRHVVKHEVLTQRDVLPIPLLSAGQGPLLALDTPAETVGQDIDAQKIGAICRGGKTVASAEVVAIICPPKEGADCVALLRTPPAETNKFAKSVIKNGSRNLSFKKKTCSK
jgi:hypothetical protein